MMGENRIGNVVKQYGPFVLYEMLQDRVNKKPHVSSRYAVFLNVGFGQPQSVTSVAAGESDLLGTVRAIHSQLQVWQRSISLAKQGQTELQGSEQLLSLYGILGNLEPRFYLVEGAINELEVEQHIPPSGIQFKGWTDTLLQIDDVIKQYGKVLLISSSKQEDVQEPSPIKYYVCIDSGAMGKMKIGEVKSDQSNLSDIANFLHVWVESQQRSIELASQVLQSIQNTSLVEWVQEIIDYLKQEFVFVQDAIPSLKADGHTD